MRKKVLSLLVAAAAALTSCADASTTTVVTTPAPTTTTTVVATTPVPTTTTTAPSTRSTTTTTLPPIRTEVIGTSLEGRPLTVEVLGEPAPYRVLVVGVIHGNEEAGLEVVDALRTLGAPPETELWLLPTLNPDGLAAGERQNANAVDLNRNFPHNWQPLGRPGDSQYAGTGPASEPETQAFVAFAERLKPDITLWYHQDLYRISPAEGFEGLVRSRYAEETGLPIETITGGVYTGIAATWQRRTQGGVSFVVELGPELAPGEAQSHAEAVHQIAALLPRPDEAP